EMDRALQVKHFSLEDPARLVVDIEGARLNAVLQAFGEKIAVSDPYIANVRVGQYTADTLRLVIDLKKKVAPQVFTLKPIDPYQHRLVVDLYSLEGADELQTLLSSLDEDPLADIIARVAKGAPNAKAKTSP